MRNFLFQLTFFHINSFAVLQESAIFAVSEEIRGSSNILKYCFQPTLYTKCKDFFKQ